MSRLNHIGIFIFVLLLAACEKEQIKPADQQPNINPEHSDDLHTAFGEFAFGLFKESNERESSEKNVILSPYSVSTALSMVYQGADGTTKVAMDEALRISALSLEEINEGNESLLNYLQNADPEVRFDLANAIFWDPQKITPFEDFLEVNTEIFEAKLESIPFDDPASVDIINNWVEEKTQGKIDKIIDAITPEEAMFLINALYLKGDWKTPFPREATAASTFNVSNQNTIEVDFMRQQGFWPYTEEPGAQIVDLGLGDSLFSVYFLLPDEATDINQYVSDLSLDRLNTLVSNLQEKHLFLSIPKFELKYKANLKEALTALGMGEAFDRSRANFSKLGTGAGNIFLSRVEHKTQVTVDENGFEGAAVTAVGVGVTSVPSPLTFDRPFLFFLRERKTGTLVFMAKVMNPLED